ncbi:hypothetical protein ACFQ1S_05775 [Kibdelosporangium lantanae]|uniref:Uncharacterized protein n=1 Tax=Kibdelosporangium lantanae TaxID=1497396 RepID=A0ABW3M4Y3_9PSEU
MNKLADTMCDTGDDARAARLATEAVEITERLLAQGAKDKVSIAVYALTTQTRAGSITERCHEPVRADESGNVRT